MKDLIWQAIIVGVVVFVGWAQKPAQKSAQEKGK